MTSNTAWIASRHRELLAIRVAMKRNQHAQTQLRRAERSILDRLAREGNQ